MFIPYYAIWRLRDEGEPEIQQRLRVVSAPNQGGYVQARWTAADGSAETGPIPAAELVGIECV